MFSSLPGAAPTDHFIETAAMLKKSAGIAQGVDGGLSFAEWNCRAGQKNVMIRSEGSVPPSP
jgi:hypothetical protein